MVAEKAKLKPSIHFTSSRSALVAKCSVSSSPSARSHSLGLLVREAGLLELAGEAKRVDRGGGHDVRPADG